MLDVQEKFAPIRKAAKLVHKSREHVRKLVDSGSVRARVKGKTNEGHPWLSVHIEDLKQAIADEEAYIPPGQPRNRQRFTRPSQLHPSAARLLQK